MRRDQISVPLSGELRQFVERAAAAEDRSIAAWVRHLVAQAARQSNHQNVEVSRCP